MKPVNHTAASGAIGLLFGAVTGSWVSAWVCFLSGVLIDIDHVLDYYLTRRNWPISYESLYKFCVFEKEGKAYLIFHSYEFIFLVWIAVVIYPLNFILWALAIGMSTHILCDHITNPYKPYFLFFIRRLRYGFDKKFIYTDNDNTKIR